MSSGSKGMLCLSAAQSISLQLPLLQCYQCVYELPLPEKVERERERFDLFFQPFDQEYLHRSIIGKSTHNAGRIAFITIFSKYLNVIVFNIMVNSKIKPLNALLIFGNK